MTGELRYQPLAQPQEVGGDRRGRVVVIPGQAIAVAGMQAQQRLEHAELQPAQIKIVRQMRGMAKRAVADTTGARRAEKAADVMRDVRSEERRAGKECGSTCRYR